MSPSRRLRRRPSCAPGHQSANSAQPRQAVRARDAPRDRLRADLPQHAFGHAPAIAREVRVDRRLDPRGPFGSAVLAQQRAPARPRAPSTTAPARAAARHARAGSRSSPASSSPRGSGPSRTLPPAPRGATPDRRPARRPPPARAPSDRARRPPPPRSRRGCPPCARGPRSVRGRRARPRCRAARCAAGCRRGATCG